MNGSVLLPSLVAVALLNEVSAFAPHPHVVSFRRRSAACFQSSNNNNQDNEEWTSDFDGWIGDVSPMESSSAGSTSQSPSSPSGSSDAAPPANKMEEPLDFDILDDDQENIPDDESKKLTKLFEEQRQKDAIPDKTGIRTRQFSLGQDLILDDYVGNLGFDEVTDWEYYYPSEDGSDDRKVVQPNPFDTSQPKRTRVSSGSVIRIFRGEFVGMVGGMISSQGLDRRVLVKEFTGKMALSLASSELAALATLQSSLLKEDDDWTPTAASRSVNLRKDNSNMVRLVRMVNAQPFLGVLGEVNLAELEGNMEPNDFYRALGVPPPKPEAVWLVYEYAGLFTVQAYAEPALVRQNNLPIKKDFFGNPIPPDRLPPWQVRAKYVVQGIVKGAIEALAQVHEQGLVHRSLGRTSIVLSSRSMDKREAVSVYATSLPNLRVKLSDFGFSTPQTSITANDPEFVARARTFGLSLTMGQAASVQTVNFAMAEDMHALGFVILALLLTSLANLQAIDDPMPPTDEDSLQRLFGEIFEKRVEELREYVLNEEIWSDLVALLDKDDSAGWKVLDSLLNAREKAASATSQENLVSVRGLLNNPFFN